MNQNSIETEILPIDPAWEYATIYTRLNELRDTFNGIIIQMGEIEHPTKETDINLRSQLLQLIVNLRITAHDL